VAGSSPEDAGRMKDLTIANLIERRSEIKSSPEYKVALLKENDTLVQASGKSYASLSMMEGANLRKLAAANVASKFGLDDIEAQITKWDEAGNHALYMDDWGEAKSRNSQSELETIGFLREQGLDDAQIDIELQKSKPEFDRPESQLRNNDATLAELYSDGNPELPRLSASSDPNVPSERDMTAAPVAAGGRRKGGQYVGAPPGIDTPGALAGLQRGYEKTVDIGAGGANWYHDASKFIADNTNNPHKAQQFADVLAVTSAGTGVDPNMGFALKGINQNVAGMPVKTGRFPQNMSKHIENILSDDKSKLGLKREPFADNLSVEWAPERGTRPVHDIWDGRAWGWKGKDGKPYDGGFSEPQHAFMDRQAMKADKRMNKKGTGGRTDWNPLRSQAAAWTGEKIKAGDINPEDAAKHFGSYNDKYTAYGTHEQVPGAGTGQLEGIVRQPVEQREAYSNDPRSSWQDEKGRDILYGDAGVVTRPSAPATGVYTPEGTGVTEFNPMTVARPMVGREGDAGNRSLGSWDTEILNSTEALRAFVDAQNAGAWHKPISDNSAGRMNSLTMDMGKQPSPEVVKELSALADSLGFFASDTGSGVNFINDAFSKQGKGRSGTDLGKDLKKGLRAELEQISGVTPQRATTESGFLNYEDEWQTPNQGAATTKLFQTLDQNPALATKLDTPAMRQKALNNLQRDAEYSRQYGLPLREDIQRVRKVLGEEGLEGLRRELKNNPETLAALDMSLEEVYG